VSLTHVERVEVYTITGQPPLRGGRWETEIAPQQVKVTLHPVGADTWAVLSVGVHGPCLAPDDIPDRQRCHYYSGERLDELPDYGQEAMAASLAALNTA
jgi:hypothetical protein